MVSSSRGAERFDGAALGFAAGVMLAVAVLNIALPHYYDRGAKAGGPYRAVGAFLKCSMCPRPQVAAGVLRRCHIC